ncbi:lipoyl(octanoyl) transferase LipB [Taylorella equigenitalis]|uniref:Octanoyltransferase n=2 Tax=Taylorella equigenitalis TaxID=29575 RepID=A0A654KGW6_TAYEM|nr:lipoyl(octanoyl) transferase LipB [Taylorella equigenitalis]ADU91625.1 Octanoate-[acyl-carrier-protein]-protein-N-octan oyltransferase [Taylorella equigenitalis MCE9]AFN35165.1 lipoate-protein ligase b [Taylorella equigenitalis ATCC 35865]ASY38609.1 octanoyltransferase [Taylorella equigenitalis]ASY40155.1 octanoyltransferase [Taylorella equigenitalis]WDU46455.1 lipoyl(octanoyl) transferase LipB [Taylorella equigenitalis]
MADPLESKVQIKDFEGFSDYQSIFTLMKSFSDSRDFDSDDELWVLQFNPVYTLGVAGDPKHVLNPKQIPVIRTNRGGQVTYHGPGQIVVYPLLNLHRKNLFVKEYVNLIEESVIDTLKLIGIPNAQRMPGAPGVYVPNSDNSLSKIASLGIKVTKGFSYHGFALNVDMDLSPFLGINPCGYEHLKVIDIKTIASNCKIDKIKFVLIERLLSRLKLLK